MIKGNLEKCQKEKWKKYAKSYQLLSCQDQTSLQRGTEDLLVIIS